MANYGLCCPFIAKLNKKTGAYSDGFRCGKAINTNIAPNYAEAKLYGDNKVAEQVREFKSAAVTLGVTHLPIEAANVMFGHEVTNGEVISDIDDCENYVGYGFYAKETVDNEKAFWAAVLPCVLFKDPGDDFETTGDSITFKTPSITGEATEDLDGKWRRKKKFTKESDAIEWIKEQLNIVEK